MITDDNFQKVRNDFESLGACVLIPTFNNERTLKQVIDGVLKYTDKIIVVNLPGRGDKDLFILAKAFKDKKFYEYMKEKVEEGL